MAINQPVPQPPVNIPIVDPDARLSLAWRQYFPKLDIAVRALVTGSGSFGSGSVTSVAMAVPTGLAVTGSPITTSGTLLLSLTGWSVDGSGNITPNSIVGTNTNNNAPAGSVGEYVVSTVTSGSPVALTSGSTSNITSISLTAGDWDVGGGVGFSGGGTTTVSLLSAGVSSTSATFDTSEYDRFFRLVYTGTPTVFGTGNPVTSLSPTRMSLSTTTTIFLVATGTFGTSTCSAFGTIRARRVR